ncbi:MAG: type II secretion system protein [Candidatus Omnitrophota bacterium]
MIKNTKAKPNLRAGGFTLVEIMIVVAIIGLLASIAVPNFIRARTQSHTNACLNNLRLIAAAKDQAGIELGLPESQTPTTTQLSPYFSSAVTLVSGLPKEPEGGSYTVGAVSVDPTCSVGGTHTL